MTLLESLQSQKNPFKGSILAKNSYKVLVFVRGEFLRLVRAKNVSLIVIIIYYMLKYTFGIKNNFGRVTTEPKKPF